MSYLVKRIRGLLRLQAELREAQDEAERWYNRWVEVSVELQQTAENAVYYQGERDELRALLREVREHRIVSHTQLVERIDAALGENNV